MYRMYEITLDENDYGARLIGNISGVGVFCVLEEHRIARGNNRTRFPLGLDKGQGMAHDDK